MKKNAALLVQPLELWNAMFDSFGRLGEAVCPSGWGRSIFGDSFSHGVRILLAGLAYGGGTLDIEAAQALMWNSLVRRYRTEDLTEEQLRTWQRMTEDDVRRSTELLGRLGALTNVDRSTRLTALAEQALRRGFDVLPGVPVLELHVAGLAEGTGAGASDLRRLHAVLQAAMGWTDSHLHMFTHGSIRYGDAEPELVLTDDKTTTLYDLTRAYPPGQLHDLRNRPCDGNGLDQILLRTAASSHSRHARRSQVAAASRSTTPATPGHVSMSASVGGPEINRSSPRWPNLVGRDGELAPPHCSSAPHRRSSMVSPAGGPLQGKALLSRRVAAAWWSRSPYSCLDWPHASQKMS
jgi:Plasmid pRiA4b ORF-3-like protein